MFFSFSRKTSNVYFPNTIGFARLPVTPKLLQGLGAMNNEDVTILLVWNGPGTNTKWTFGQVGCASVSSVSYI